ncbi:MAG TPA: hypothetical protein VLX92_01415 [Kofleriaceae bacterium]|nr:hypothetical protein [Kofleriaceae bacterium]
MAAKRRTASTVEELIAAEDWTGARRKLQAELRESPGSHWLMSRLALTYYEQRNYRSALDLEKRALRIAPRCPLSLWGLAGAHDMLGRKTEATALYMQLIRRGVQRLAHGDCGEGVPWARGLVADCWYRVGAIRDDQGDVHGATVAFQRHLQHRRRGSSIYSVRDVRAKLRALAARAKQRQP